MAINPMLIQSGANLLGGGLETIGNIKATNRALSQINKAMQESEAMSGAERQYQTDLSQPWMSAGQIALGELESFRMARPESYQVQEFGGVDMSQDPGAQYRMDQMLKGLDASAAAQGRLFSGAQQRGIAKELGNLASQEYAQAYGRQYGQFRDLEDARRQQANLEAERGIGLDQYRMSQLQGLAGMGQSETGRLGSASQNIYGTQLQNQMMLRGAKGDLAAAKARAPYQFFGQTAGDLGSIYGNLEAFKMGAK